MSDQLKCILLFAALLLSGSSIGQTSTTSSDSLPKIITNIHLVGNRVTKERIILRELTFKSGDTIPAGQLEAMLVQSQKNLFNTSLFNKVTIQKLPIDEVYTELLITCVERWYTWPIPIFELAETNFNTWWLTRDFSRTNYGFVVYRQNFRGRNEETGFKVQLGYSKEFAFLYKAPYVNKKQNLGLGLYTGYIQRNELVTATENNKRIFYTGTDGNIRDEFIAKVHATYRKKIFDSHTLELRYTAAKMDSEIAEVATDYFLKGSNRMKYMGLVYTFRNDHRDNKPYPLNGHYFQLDLVQNGLGIANRDGLNVFYPILQYKQFLHLGKKFYWAGGIRAKWTPSKENPYYLQEGLGYNNFVRGYEYYVIDGQHYGMIRSNFKYQLVSPRFRTLKKMKNTRFNTFHYAFYLNAFTDLGYVKDDLYAANNALANSTLFGTGLGIDFVTYYDKVLRVEYSFNKMGESGIFIHFVQPI
jgi:hypothetical protein